MLREKEIENTVGYIWINSILKKLEELDLITGKELECAIPAKMDTKKLQKTK